MIVVQYILPALRVAIAKQLVEEHALKKTQVAELMEVTPAAITQYLNKSRGDSASAMVERSERVTNIVSEIALDLVEGRTPSDMLIMKLCRACYALRAEELICELHREAMPSLRQLTSCSCSLGLVAWDLVSDKVE